MSAMTSEAPALRSSVLVVGHPSQSEVGFGADFATDFKQARELFGAERAYPVVAFAADAKNPTLAADFLAELAAGGKDDAQLVIVQNDAPPETMRRLINRGDVFRVLPSFSDPRFERTIQEALEEHALARQNAKLFQLVNEQNEKLTRLSAELEDRVERRERHLKEARERLVVANNRTEALHRALIAVHRARSTAEMERLINEALSGALGLSWTRISFGVQRAGSGAMRGQQERLFAMHASPLVRGKELLGEIAFARDQARPFARDEASFLQQIAEAVSLAIDRLSKLEQSEALKHQWEATFDAIDEPVAILDQNRTIARTNRAFALVAGATAQTSVDESASTASEAVLGRKCFTAMFGRTTPCEGCKLGSNFQLAPAVTVGGMSPIYRVFSSTASGTETPPFVNMYRDVAPQLRLESQLLESAKMAELGTIGSSIAHELNNPLGGMLSFLQLIKMDLKGDEPWNDDVLEMERGALRCRDIVQNLLGFARKSLPEADSDTHGVVDLREAVAQALKIAELQTRAMGVRVSLVSPAAPSLARGQFNLLSQALRFFLQDAQDAIAARAKQEAQAPRAGDPHARFRGEISVSIASDEGGGSRVEITDNGWRKDVPKSVGPENLVASAATPADSSAPDLGLTVALGIVAAHGGLAEIQRVLPFGAIAKISFPRPVPPSV